MLCVAAWVWFCLSTEFVVVPLDRYDPAASGGGDIPARPAWSTSLATRTGDWGVVKRIDAGAHPSSPRQMCPSMALHPSHAMSTASVPGPDSIAANLDFAPIAALAPTLHDVTAARPDLMAWLLHHLYGLLCEAVFFWIPLDIIWWLFADGAFSLRSNFGCSWACTFAPWACTFAAPCRRCSAAGATRWTT